MQCKYCGKELKNQGALNLHERRCEKNPDRIIQVKVSELRGRKTEDSCDHEWHKLNRSIPAQAAAAMDGYHDYCIRCKELRK